APLNSLYTKLVDLWKLPHDVLNRTWKHIDAPHNDHIIHPPQDSTLQTDEEPAALARFTSRLDEIAGPVANHRAASPAEIGDNQLAFVSFFDCHAAFRIYHLGNEFALVDMDATGSGLALEPESAHLSRSGMIVTFSAPHCFNHVFGARYAFPRLAGMDDDSYRRLLRQVDADFSRLRGHVDRVSRRTNQNRCPAVDNCSYALHCRLASPLVGQGT